MNDAEQEEADYLLGYLKGVLTPHSRIIRYIVRFHTEGDLDRLRCHGKLLTKPNTSLFMDIEFAYAIAANHTDRTPSELLTAEMLPLHGLIREDLEYSSVFHPSETLDRLAGYIFLNMERMEDILMLWRERRIPDPEQIELLLNEVDARSLMRGAL